MFGPIFGPVGTIWAHVGPNFGRMGLPCTHLRSYWDTFGYFGLSWGCLVPSWEHFEATLGHFRVIWKQFGAILDHRKAMLLNN